MSDLKESATGMRALQARLQDAMAGLKRPQVADEASEIASRVFGDSAPLIDGDIVRDIDSRRVTPPPDGHALRCILAAVNVPLVEALEVMGYWPDARVMAARSTAAAITEAVKLVGYPDAKLVGTHGRRIIIEI